MVRILRLIRRMIPLFIILGIFFVVLQIRTGFLGIGSDKSSEKESKLTKTGINLSAENRNFTGRVSSNGSIGFPETVEQIMERDKLLPHDNIPLKENDLEERLNYPDRKNLPQNPESKNESSYPPAGDQKSKEHGSKDNPQTLSTNFTGITVSEAGFIPADNMGAVGPAQVIMIANGRIKSFNKTTGVQDGVINTTTDNFFASVGGTTDGTSDPRIRYDRMSQRWFAVMITVPAAANRILIAVSNTSTITVSTVWTFYFISAPAGVFHDYPTLGIDVNAIYIGTNNFNVAGTLFLGTSGYVIPKSGLLIGSATAYLFSLVTSGSSSGPYTPQGVDNFDASSTLGYFIGVDNLVFGQLDIIRVSTPGGTPTVSSPINIVVNTTTFPMSVPQIGSTAVLSALDDRLFAACVRNGRLWTAHNVQVNSSGVASNSGGRNGTRWYEITNLTGTPSVNQSGTIFDPAASNPLSYWIPTVMVSGQGHAAFIFSSCGSNAHANTSSSGRLSSDALGTTQSVITITSSSSTYALGAPSPKRWGDYSYVSLDPDDDMTMWGVEGYCNSTNSWGEHAAKLLAPPPAALSSANPPTLTPGQSSVNVIITGTSVSGSGFYDPGAGFSSRISASISGGVTVNSTTYNSPTQLMLNVSTVGATTGSKTVTITNPDGQTSVNSSIFSVPLPVALSSFISSVNKRDVTLSWSTTFELNNQGFDIERKKESGLPLGNDWSKIGFIPGHGTTNDPQNYTFKDSKLQTGKYNYRLKQIDYDGTYERYSLNEVVNIGIPSGIDVSQNYPNPFNPLTKIDYSIPFDGIVKLQIFDITGKEVAAVINEPKSAGYYTAEFDASNLASGVYFYKLLVKNPSGDNIFTNTKKMLVVK